MNYGTMEGQHFITQAEAFVKQELAGAEGGHDWWHTYRVWKLARRIAEQEEVDRLIVELSAILHDVADAKFYGGDETIGPKKVRDFLRKIHVPMNVVEHVVKIIQFMSFRSSHNEGAFFSQELAVVRDADRLDALGAIGVGRAFSFGGYKGSPMYDPHIPPKLNMSREEYKKRKGTTINHFYEKLFLLKDLLHTDTAKQIAESRHSFMEAFVQQFLAEWEGGC